MRFQKQIVPFITVPTLSLKFPVTESSSAPPSCLHTVPQSPQKHAAPSPRTTAPTLPNPHYPLPRTITLASLVKGRWIDGKAQTVALLHFYLRYIHLFDLSNFSLSRRRDCLITIPLAFRRASVCVRLYGFASALSHLAFRRGVSLLLPLHRTSLSPSIISKVQPSLAPHNHTCLLMNALLVSHPCETPSVQLRASMTVPCQR